jgi:hypothetical protein
LGASSGVSHGKDAERNWRCDFAESAAGGSDVPQVLDIVKLLENGSQDLEWEAVGHTSIRNINLRNLREILRIKLECASVNQVLTPQLSRSVLIN